jgi:hypothetical protein
VLGWSSQAERVTSAGLETDGIVQLRFSQFKQP